MTQPTRIRRTAASGRPVRDANFLPKRERKVIRKGLIRAALSNRVAEARVGAAERAEFYRNLRLMKVRRRAIAKEMFVLVAMVDGLTRQVDRVGDRLDHRPTQTPEEQAAEKALVAAVDEALDAGQAAERAVSAAAGEFQEFSRRKIYYTQAVA